MTGKPETMIDPGWKFPAWLVKAIETYAGADRRTVENEAIHLLEKELTRGNTSLWGALRYGDSVLSPLQSGDTGK